jgi:hypothetical protein
MTKTPKEGHPGPMDLGYPSPIGRQTPSGARRSPLPAVVLRAVTVPHRHRSASPHRSHGQDASRPADRSATRVKSLSLKPPISYRFGRLLSMAEAA